MSTRSPGCALPAGEAALVLREQAPPLPGRGALPRLCPGFADHLERLRGKLITGKTVQKLLDNDLDYIVSTPDNFSYVSEKVRNVLNAATLLQYSNMTPFKSRNKMGFPCFYCKLAFENLRSLKVHQDRDHSNKNEIKTVLSMYTTENFVVYVDVTDIQCTICHENMSKISDLKTHLVNVHKKTLYVLKDKVVPYKLSETNVFECQVCGFNFETFGSIERHMNTHYRNHICNYCGSGFVTKYRMKVHVKNMHADGHHECDVCKKIFTTTSKLKNHIASVHLAVKRFKCPKCSERFAEYFKRQKHVFTAHGGAPPCCYKCNVCDKGFDRRYSLSRHMKRDHLEVRDFQCELCPYNCFTNNELKVHMIKHSGKRIFECDICQKSYARKKTLTEHLKIHNNDRRFVCMVCGQAFVQKCSLKGHMKTHHAEHVGSL